MTLRTIRIANVKGIADRTFSLNIIPNKPSLLYAPNGFGKSSFAIAFDSLTGPRLSLHKDHYHKGTDANLPSLSIDYQKTDGTVANLLADSTTNTIKTEIDCFVINNKVRPKSTPMQFNGRTQHTASLNIDTIELIGSIPVDTDLGYNVGAIRGRFGNNGKVLPNLEPALAKRAFVVIFNDGIRHLSRLTQIRNSEAIQSFKDRINQQVGTSDQILNWIEANELAVLDEILPLKELTDQIMDLDLGYTRRAERVLAVLEMLDLYSGNTANFKPACDRKLYIQEKKSYIESFKAFNSTWKDIRPREKGGKLIIEFPKAHNISNGQRDILCLVALLEVARRKLKKDASILIIDEVFDYLDEGNLIAAQYYVTEFIKDFKNQGRRIYPLILTHLNPGYFKSYAFSKMKTYYLDTRTATVSLAFKNLIIHREDPTIADELSRCLLHYHTDNINKRAEFTALGLRPTWGEGTNFINHLQAEMNKYLTDQPDYDPFAVCCALRRRVEEKVYQNIPGLVEKDTFLATHQTKNKLEYAESIGVSVPEYYYLLGNVYNDGLHWKTDRDNESPLKAKLENGTIRKLINDICG
ncbi:hypothetical protein [Pedobacter nyackensis]|uniref:hypothetical protein n=1 Tax=Pedobacter nyackensis TaxID=475255 RepID=UPI00293174F8|nr:hypothetical protein [Pedobacter nyackensis]